MVTTPLPDVRLVEVDGSNWRAAAAVTPQAGQDRFVAAVAYYLCLAHYGGLWHPLGVEVDGSIVGHVMWAVDDEDESVWLGGLVIDAAAQGVGVGRATVMAFLRRFSQDGNVNVALSYSPDNTIARKLYADIGFVETGEMEDDEIVARFQRDDVPVP
jgi:diamine N-acetyltransferase